MAGILTHVTIGGESTTGIRTRTRVLWLRRARVHVCAVVHIPRLGPFSRPLARSARYRLVPQQVSFASLQNSNVVPTSDELLLWYSGMSREWAILVPAWTVVLVLLTYFSYFALALARTPGFSDLSTITGWSFCHTPRSLLMLVPFDLILSTVDEHALIPVTETAEDGRSLVNPYLRFAAPDAVPEIYDLPIGLVNRVLYSRPRSSSTVGSQ